MMFFYFLFVGTCTYSHRKISQTALENLLSEVLFREWNELWVGTIYRMKNNSDFPKLKLGKIVKLKV